ncbi:malonate decarboxylase subunit epsilon [Luteibacter sp. dw_328]|uniref:malonate decarboxylase subunit epsilon n=1 Tax=Luteibacter sp. dw_328 TaxID=2719796 RepID=UPI001BD1ED02|nr:malonate decarboxylase subunit epsilon [Luteibacter sp. dw_328]
MRIALLCSGQGGQHAGMFELTKDAAEALDIFAMGATLFGEDPRRWVKTASEEAFRENRHAQRLCAIQTLTVAAALARDLPPERCIAGYSVGEVAAWGVAGLLTSNEVLELIGARADAMDRAREGEQGMLFVRGLDRSVVDALVDQREAALAIVNPGDAYVLAGLASALDAIAADARQKGASRVVPVRVGIASHTRFMTEASASFRQRLASVAVGRTVSYGTRLFSGIDGAPVLEVSQGLDKLARQISQPVQWKACLDACVEAGADVFLELGPGRALADMVSATYPGVAARSVDEFRSLDGVRAWLASRGS